MNDTKTYMVGKNNITITIQEEGVNEMTIYEIGQLLRSLLLSMTYTKETINKILPTLDALHDMEDSNTIIEV